MSERSDQLNEAISEGVTAALEAEAEWAAQIDATLVRLARSAVDRFRSAAVAITAAAAEDWHLPDPDEILVLSDAVAELEAVLNEPRVEAMRRTAEPALLRFAISWDVDNPLIAAQLERLAARVTGISETLRQDIADLLAAAHRDGLGIPETARQLRETMLGELEPGQASHARAVRIARTEMIGASNAASWTAARLTGAATHKIWATAGDRRVRATHAAAEGQSQPLNEPFTVGGFPLQYPGDPAGPVDEVVSCRCSVVYDDLALAAAGAPSEEDPMARRNGGAIASRDRGSNSLVAAPDTAPADDPAAVDDAIGWEAILCVEGVPTVDGRVLAVGGGTWRPLPLTLMAMTTESAWGHEGAQVAGRIDAITAMSGASARSELERFGVDASGLPDALRVLSSTGVFDTGEYGQDIARMVDEQTLRGVSIDPWVSAIEYRLADEDGNPTDDEATDEDLFEWFWLGEGPEIITVYAEYRLLGATVCHFPAIEQATIQIGGQAAAVIASGDHDHRPRIVGVMRLVKPLTASAAGLVAEHPPAAWFDDPHLAAATPLAVDDSGRVRGHLALWRSCHIASPQGAGICTAPPHTSTAYAVFHTGACRTADGHDVAVGQITLGTGHAPLAMNRAQAAEHYDNTGTAVADVCCGEDAHGIWVAGALRPDTPAARVRELRGAKLSGDWRDLNGRLELVGVLAVNVPGFPVPRVGARTAAATPQSEPRPVALVAAGRVVEDETAGRLRALARRATAPERLAALAARAVGR